MPVANATGYTLQLRTEGERPRRFTVDGANQWTLPASEAALTQGRTYQWTVAPAGGRPTREEPFTVIGDQDRQALELGIQAINGMGLDPLAEGRMLAAVIFTDLGLYYDAVAALAELEQAGDPFNADLYLLKGEVLDRLGRLDEAREAFDRADALLRG
jgi:tetratricopeptide (TPR) repeat protein